MEINELLKESKEKSIGEDKKCEYLPQKKRVTSKGLKALLALLISAITLTGCSKNNENYETDNSYKDPYVVGQMLDNERDELYDYLEEHGIIDYKSNINNTRTYNYDVDTYQQLTDLDENMLYSFYLYTDDDTFNNVLTVLGYTDLNDFLEKNDYVDSNGKPSISKWRENDVNLKMNTINEGKKHL